MKKYIFILLILVIGTAVAEKHYHIEPDTVSVNRLNWGNNSVSFYFSTTGFQKAKFTVIEVNGGRRRSLLFGHISSVTLYSVSKIDNIIIKIYTIDNILLDTKLIHKGTK